MTHNELKGVLKEQFKLARCVKTNNIGKYIGGFVYIHKSEIDNIGLPHVKHMVGLVHIDTTFNIIKIDLGNSADHSISLINSPDFNTSSEPTICESVKITIDVNNKLTIRKCNGRTTNKLIYHHKWLFISEDSQLFDIDESMNRSMEWLPTARKTTVNKSKIGGCDYWDSWLTENNLHPRK